MDPSPLQAGSECSSQFGENQAPQFLATNIPGYHKSNKFILNCHTHEASAFKVSFHDCSSINNFEKDNLFAGIWATFQFWERTVCTRLSQIARFPEILFAIDPSSKVCVFSHK